MPEFTTFSDFQQQFFEQHGNPDTQQAAFELVNASLAHFPEQANLLYNWRYCAAALLGKPDLALQIMQEGLEAGYWWGKEILVNDDDLKSLLDMPEFQRLVQVSEARRAAAQAEAQPLALTLPLPAPATAPLPLLMALHGNNSNAQDSVETWESAVGRGWLTVLLQSSQVFGPQAFVWNDLELGAQEIKAQYRELSQGYSLAEHQVVVGGHSKGGEMAIWLALKEVIPLAGFIAVNPGGPSIQDIEQWKPYLNKRKTLADPRGFFLVGENDANLEQIQALHELFVSHGLNCALEVAPETGHGFPDDFDQVLARALDFVTQP